MLIKIDCLRRLEPKGIERRFESPEDYYAYIEEITTPEHSFADEFLTQYFNDPIKANKEGVFVSKKNNWINRFRSKKLNLIYRTEELPIILGLARQKFDEKAYQPSDEELFNSHTQGLSIEEGELELIENLVFEDKPYKTITYVGKTSEAYEPEIGYPDPDVHRGMIAQRITGLAGKLVVSPSGICSVDLKKVSRTVCVSQQRVSDAALSRHYGRRDF